MQGTNRLHPIILAVAAQATAALVLVGLIQLAWQLVSYDPGLLIKLALQSLMATGLSYFFRLPRWWLGIQAILPFAFYGLILLHIPAWSYLLIFTLLLLLYWNSADDRVPLYLTNNATARAISESLLRQDLYPEGGIFMDLGCGPAGLLIRLARQHPDWQFVGVESAPLLWLLAAMNAKLSGLKNISIRRQSLWRTSIQDADIIYVFLSPAPMGALYKKATDEAARGSVLVSNSFQVPEIRPNRTIEVDDNRQTVLYLWYIPNK